MAEGLRTLEDTNATNLANKWTRRWTLSNFIAYNETRFMFEKVKIAKVSYVRSDVTISKLNNEKLKFALLLILNSSTRPKHWAAMGVAVNMLCKLVLAGRMALLSIIWPNMVKH